MRIEWLFLLAPVIAFATETALHADMSTLEFWLTLLCVQGLTMIGYGASSLALWAKWPDGSLEQRLTIVQGMLVAGLAGNIGYYYSYYSMAFPQIGSFTLAALCSFGGDKFVSPLVTRAVTLFNAALGNGKTP